MLNSTPTVGPNVCVLCLNTKLSIWRIHLLLQTWCCIALRSGASLIADTQNPHWIRGPKQ